MRILTYKRTPTPPPHHGHRGRMTPVAEQFSWKYDGPALASHRMNARDLAPAMLGLADALEAIHKLHEPNVPISVEIQAHNSGSFDVEIVVEVMRTVRDLFSSDTADAAANMATTVTILGAAIMTIQSFATKGKVSNVEDVTNTSGEVTHKHITFANGTQETLDEHTWRATGDPKVIQGLYNAIKPLREDAIDSVAMTYNNHVERVDVTQRHAFEPPVTADDEEVHVSTLWLEVISPVFQSGAKWKFFDGRTKFWATITDATFMERINGHDVVFGQGDTLQVRLETTQHLESGRIIATSSTVLEVLDHRVAGKQGELTFETPEDDEPTEQSD